MSKNSISLVKTLLWDPCYCPLCNSMNNSLGSCGKTSQNTPSDWGSFHVWIFQPPAFAFISQKLQESAPGSLCISWSKRSLSNVLFFKCGVFEMRRCGSVVIKTWTVPDVIMGLLVALALTPQVSCDPSERAPILLFCSCCPFSCEFCQVFNNFQAD